MLPRDFASRVPRMSVKKISPQRYTELLAATLTQNTQWATAEPNGPTLWAKMCGAISDHLLGEWKSGVLLGSKPEEAFFVRCDRTTMTQADIDDGRLICLVGVAPVKPAEFVIFRVEHRTAGKYA